MARRYRFVVPGMPHHVIQRGNRRQPVFFSDHDRLYYLRLLKEHAGKFGVKIWAYCLMTNHVHLVLVPVAPDSLAKAVAETHRRYTRMINFREQWRGYLWQGRFSSFVMDDAYSLKALRYVERNPVRAGMVKKASEYAWSSARAHVEGVANEYLDVCPVIERIGNWDKCLSSEIEDDVLKKFRSHAGTGRPVGGDVFVKEVASILNVSVEELKGRLQGRPRKPGNRGHITFIQKM